MDLTRDKLCSLIKKWQTLIEAQVDVRTTDGYLLRIVSTFVSLGSDPNTSGLMRYGQWLTVLCRFAFAVFGLLRC